MKERTKILNHMIAKTDRTDNELWLPLWMHSYDTAGVMEYLYHNWVPPAAIKVICKDMGEEMGLKVCLFLAYCHDTAKMTYVFQSNISEGVKIIREAIIQEGIKLIDPKKLTNRISHSLCGEGILRKYGVPIGISVIVGSHHGKTPDECSDEIEEKIENYGKDVFFGQQRGKWEAIWKEWLDTALEKSGFEVNKKLWNFYSKGEGSKYARKTAGMVAEEGEKTTEVPWNVYTDDVKDSVASYGDAAIVVLSRIGGEGADLDFKETNYLALDDNEKEMLQNVAEMKKAGQVKKIVVLINSANTLQVDFLKNNEYDVDACMWIGDVGISGINAVAEILAGNVTPSGSLVDTYLYDNFSAPAMMNFVPTVYEGYEEGIIPEHAKTYMIYQEGIYVGYKYYETRYEDYVMQSGNSGAYEYHDDVAYPFGYGMSYTDFKYSDLKVSYNKEKDVFEVSVKVTNTGKEYSGKENCSGLLPVSIYSI